MNTSKKHCSNSPSMDTLKPLSDDNNVAYNRNHLKRKSSKQGSYVELHDDSTNTINIDYKNTKCNQYGLKVNLKLHKEPIDKSFMCVICLRSFDLVRSLIKHFSNSHKMPSKCSICHERCSSHKLLIEHSLLHSKQPVNSDEHLHAKKIGRNKISHGKENSFSCEFCPRMFIREKCLNNHMNIHTKEALVCKFCEKKFLFNTRLLKHLQEVHHISDSDLDNKVLQNVSKTRNKDMNLQMDQSPLCQPEENSCVLCNDTFSSSYELGLHLIQHAEEYEKMCDDSNSCDDSDIEIIID